MVQGARTMKVYQITQEQLDRLNALTDVLVILDPTERTADFLVEIINEIEYDHLSGN